MAQMTQTFVMKKMMLGSVKVSIYFCVAFKNAQSEADACSVGAC